MQPVNKKTTGVLLAFLAAGMLGFAFAAVGFYHLAERDGALHGLLVINQIFSQTLFRQGFPAADDFRRVVYF